VEMSVKLVPARSEFVVLRGGDAVPAGKIKIHEASLIVRKVTLNPSVALGHAAALKVSPALYPINRTEVRSFTIPAGTSSYTFDNICLGQLPKLVVLGMVKNASYNGNRNNPFNFEMFKLTQLALYSNGKLVTGRPLTFETNGESKNIMGYHSMFAGTGIFHTDDGIDISRTEYEQGNALFCFDLTSSLMGNQTGMMHLRKSGSLRLELVFGEILAHTVTVIGYMSYENIIRIDSDRNVIVDFGV
jgi:hypothetical protein